MKLGFFQKMLYLEISTRERFCLVDSYRNMSLAWHHIQSSCPEANNITAWKKASLRLNCSEYSETYSEEVIIGKKLYYCLSSSFLNETIEFCGPNAAIEKGLYVLISFILSFLILSHMQTISPGCGCVYLSLFVVAKTCALIRMILWSYRMHDVIRWRGKRRCYTTSYGVSKIGRVHYSESSLESWSHLILNLFSFIYFSWFSSFW